MPLSYVLGNVLVSQDEIRERARRGDQELQAVGTAIRRMQLGGTGHDALISFTTGSVSAVDLLAPAGMADTAPPFEPVGVGRPATIMLRHVYTGRLGKKDMLLTSAVRDPFTTFNQAPRATNLMPKRVPRHAHINGPLATESGTELVYYIEALTAQSLTLTLEMAFDDFPDELVDRIGGTISTVGGIPVFGPYGGVLLAVGAAVKLASKLINALVDARAEFTMTERLDFQVPGSPIPDAGFKVMHGEALNIADFTFELNRGLIHKDSQKVYDGDEPYIVFLLDGTKTDSFKAFTPTATSAALLSRFLSQKEGSEVALDAITDAFKLYNDLRYRREADRLQEQIDALPPNSPEREKLEEKRKAALANILEKLLKPAH